MNGDGESSGHYGVGQRVVLRIDRSRAGVVVGVLPGYGGRTRYRVFHGPDERQYDEDQLVVVDLPAEDALVNALTTGHVVSPQEFRARLAAARLAHPAIDDLYAMRAARILHVPFQYKPILRLLRADQPRLLIADDVGVGKTIEAGLILKELQARGDIERVLILCPRSLAQKWRGEMRRFDERFEVLTGPTLRYCIQEAHVDGWPVDKSRVILPLELIQRQDYLQGDQRHPGLLTLAEAPHFDLIIIDEAHHLRNPETGRYAAAHFLAAVSQAMVLLSATPVHVGAENLFTLLNLLRPDLFPNFETFQRMVEPNRYLTDAMRLVRSGRANDQWQQQAAAAMDRAAATPWGTEALSRNPEFAFWQSRLHQDSELSDEDRVRCLRELEEAHSLALVMNRTRRRDIGRFTQREPQTVEVPFTQAQREFYDDLVAWQRRVLEFKYGGLVASLVLSQIERRAASCLFAVGDTLTSIVETGEIRQETAEDGASDEEGATGELSLPPELRREAEELLGRFRALPPEDPKLDELVRVVRESLDATDGPGKLLVFTYFRHTIGYLADALRAHDVRLGVVHGGVDDDERQRIRDCFRLSREQPQAIDVLLSTEVGAEGLDYEFCDRMVNYDIPWNPMRIEQRIGRIDRFGQQSPKVLIFNFVTPGTIEERVFMRCYDRLGVFRDTVGDLEEVLGETVQALTRLAADVTLTPTQVAERAQQEADNVLRLTDEQRRLEDERPGLLGLDTALEEEAREIDRRGRFVTGDELRVLIDEFLRHSFDSPLRADPADPTRRIMQLHMSQPSQRDTLRNLLARPRYDPTANEVRRTLAEGRDVALTFDQQVAVERRDVAFITPVHALARAASSYWQDRTDPLVTQLSVRDPSLPPGRYLFALERWEERAARPAVQLVSVAAVLDDGAEAPGIASELLRLIQAADGQPGDNAPVSIPRETVEALNRQAQDQRAAAIAALQATNAALVDQRIASLDLFYRGLIAQLDTVLADSTDARITRMKTAERQRREAELRRRREELERQRDADILADRIALGILEVRHDD